VPALSRLMGILCETVRSCARKVWVHTNETNSSPATASSGANLGSTDYLQFNIGLIYAFRISYNSTTMESPSSRSTRPPLQRQIRYNTIRFFRSYNRIRSYLILLLAHPHFPVIVVAKVPLLPPRRALDLDLTFGLVMTLAFAD